MNALSWWQSKFSTQAHDPGHEDDPPALNIGVDIAYPMQKVMIRWHTLDNGEVSIPGQILDVDGEVVSVWFNRNVSSYNPYHADDRVWLDTFEGHVTQIFAGWLIGMRPPDTLVINIDGLPRRDQRRQHVRELVTLPPQPVVQLTEAGDPAGPVVEATVHDLSGGGVRIGLDMPLDKGTKFLLSLALDAEPFDVEVTVIDGLRSLTGGHIIRGFFSEIRESDRRSIVRYVFREQIRKARLAS